MDLWKHDRSPGIVGEIYRTSGVTDRRSFNFGWRCLGSMWTLARTYLTNGFRLMWNMQIIGMECEAKDWVGSGSVPDEVVRREEWLRGWGKRMRSQAGEIWGCRWHLLCALTRLWNRFWKMSLHQVLSRPSRDPRVTLAVLLITHSHWKGGFKSKDTSEDPEWP